MYVTYIIPHNFDYVGIAVTHNFDYVVFLFIAVIVPISEFGDDGHRLFHTMFVKGFCEIFSKKFLTPQ